MKRCLARYARPRCDREPNLRIVEGNLPSLREQVGRAADTDRERLLIELHRLERDQAVLLAKLQALGEIGALSLPVVPAQAGTHLLISALCAAAQPSRRTAMLRPAAGARQKQEAHMLSSAPQQQRLARRTLALVLAGGRGSRLKQLTDRRAKPAVFFGGKFRIIDFALVELPQFERPADLRS